MDDVKEVSPRGWASQSLKLAKVLRNQIRALEMEVVCDEAALQRFRCAGFVTGGEPELFKPEHLKQY